MIPPSDSQTSAGLLAETTDYLHRQIPLSCAMGIRVAAYTGETLTLSAPAELNHNHLGTAFGGSLSALATLAGYALLWLELGNRESHIVIHSSSIRYLRPLRGELRAVCRRPGAEELRDFKTKFARAGKARIRLAVLIGPEEAPAVEFEGVYVALI